MDTSRFSHPLLKSFVSGSVSGTCSLILFQPFDLVKTRIQMAAAKTALSMPGITSKGGMAMQSTMYSIARSVIETESIRGLWKGFSPSFFRCVPGVGMYFTSLHWLKSEYYSDRKPSALESVILGASARTFTTACMLPMTVIKTRFESGSFKYRSVWQALFNIQHTEGSKGLYRGLTPTLLRDAPFSGLYLMVYNSAKELGDGGSLYNFACGIVAGTFASIVTQPADVIKTKMQVSQSSAKVVDVILYIYKKHGLYGYFAGLAPRVTRRTLMAAMAWTVYEYLNK
ncbi:mitochondrial glycine transporter-like [Clavelina lepadiformis]|uniref:mitochondrial glycine transporter-like n=1 Tax=Clavelina lepadiformis TaxID=159417 RepID=UPI004043307A